MIKILTTICAISTPIAALATPLEFADWRYTYTTSTFTTVTYDDVSQAEPRDAHVGQSRSFELLIYGEQFVNEIQDGTYRLTTNSPFSDLIFETIATDGSDWSDVDLTLTFFNTFIVSWFGYVRDGSSADGFVWLDSSGTDSFRSHHATTNHTDFRGFWSFPELRQICEGPDGQGAVICSGNPPDFPTEVPLPASVVLLGVGLAGLGAYFGRRRDHEAS